MIPNSYFFVMVAGPPLLLLAIGLVAQHFYRGGYEQLLDWKPTRSPEREAELRGDTHQMVGALNRYRRLRGAPELSLEEIAEHTWARLDRHEDESS